jgi:hypothetical protein
MVAKAASMSWSVRVCKTAVAARTGATSRAYLAQELEASLSGSTSMAITAALSANS